MNSFVVMNPESSQQQLPRPYRLKNTIQHYEWGKRNQQALIAELLGLDPEQDKPYAELWIGTHPKAPSQIIDPDNGLINLADWISQNPNEHLRSDQAKAFPTELPFLFKVLSADQALSIQAHPNKEQAQQLHQHDPEHYPDANHKPEIAIAIDSLDALIGFISEAEYHELMQSVPELTGLLQNRKAIDLSLTNTILTLLELAETSPDQIETCIIAIENRFESKNRPTETELLFLEQAEIHGQKDIGLLFLLFLNRVQLAPGEAVFLPPGIPHAYLKGNIIECMANSDNVVRLGLTNKFCDAQALAEVLNFQDDSDFRVKTITDNLLTEYDTPTKEYRVKSLTMPHGESVDFSNQTKLSIYFVLEGQVNLHWCSDVESCCNVYRRGDSFVVPANLHQFTLQARNNSKLYLVDIP